MITLDMLAPIRNACAVYLLLGEDGVCLYVGSSVRVKDRLRSHPYREAASGLRVIPCSEELLAETEQSCIDLHKPVLNKRLRVARIPPSTRERNKALKEHRYRMEREEVLAAAARYWQTHELTHELKMAIVGNYLQPFISVREAEEVPA